MKDSTLLKIALICSITGTIALFFITQNTSLETNNVLTSEDEELILVVGKIVNYESKEGLTILDIEYTSTIKGVIFEDVIVQDNSLVEVIGSIGEFKGEKELFIEKIEEIIVD